MRPEFVVTLTVIECNNLCVYTYYDTNIICMGKTDQFTVATFIKKIRITTFLKAKLNNSDD